MRDDIHDHCRSCLGCVSRKGGHRSLKPPLQPIPVGGPFHRVAVDVLQLPLTVRGNCYVVVFTDYFTKWPEAFAVADQTAETIARLFAEEIICRHGIPEELLSDRRANFLSNLVLELCKILGVKKINTSGYHPQTDGMVERFNSTLTSMIAKSCDIRDRDWDDHLPFLLFAYRASAQDSTKESPFFLLHSLRRYCVKLCCPLTGVHTRWTLKTTKWNFALASLLHGNWLKEISREHKLPRNAATIRVPRK